MPVIKAYSYMLNKLFESPHPNEKHQLFCPTRKWWSSTEISTVVILLDDYENDEDDAMVSEEQLNLLLHKALKMMPDNKLNEKNKINWIKRDEDFRILLF